MSQARKLCSYIMREGTEPRKLPYTYSGENDWPSCGEIRCPELTNQSLNRGMTTTGLLVYDELTVLHSHKMMGSFAWVTNIKSA